MFPAIRLLDLVAIGALAVVIFESRNLWRIWRQIQEDERIMRRLKNSMPKDSALMFSSAACLCPKGHLGFHLASCPLGQLTTAPATKVGLSAAESWRIVYRMLEQVLEELEPEAPEIRHEILGKWSWALVEAGIVPWPEEAMASTTPPTSPSPPSDPPATPNGPVGQSCVFGGWRIRQMDWGLEGQMHGQSPVELILESIVEPTAGLLERYVRILVPAVAQTPSTSRNLASPSFAQETTGAR